jgi:hypothetical protein
MINRNKYLDNHGTSVDPLFDKIDTLMLALEDARLFAVLS